MRLYPLLTFPVLTLGTMTVAATVVADTYLSTFGTHLHMSSHFCGSARYHGGKRVAHLRHYLVAAEKGFFISAYDVGHLIFGSHREESLKMSSISEMQLCRSNLAT